MKKYMTPELSEFTLEDVLLTSLNDNTKDDGFDDGYDQPDDTFIIAD